MERNKQQQQQQICLEERTYMAIDPGVKNTAVAVMRVCPQHKPFLLWSRTFSMDQNTMLRTVKPNADAANFMRKEIIKAIYEYSPECVLIEYQPPMMRSTTLRHLIRYNSWIEGFLFATVMETGVQAVHSSPSSVKSHFGIKSSTYHGTKKAVITTARCYVESLPRDMTDHVADCILMILHFNDTN